VQAAAGLAVLDVLDDEALLARVRRVGEEVLHRLAELPRVAEVRGRGLMLAFDLDAGGPTAPELVERALLEERLVVNATGPATIRLLPPLVVSDEELEDALARLGRVLGG
jgi:acetylornithine aminotransferase/acetylornithine/N-succinyldiaminopimelate aminotransferase